MQFPEKLPGEDFVHSFYPILIALVLGLILGFRNYFKGPDCKSTKLLKNKTVVVTGASSGMGLELAKDFAMRGARVILACRSKDKAEAAIDEIKLQTKDSSLSLVPMHCDLESFASVRTFAKNFISAESRLDILIHNAGIMCHPVEDRFTEDKYDIQLQVNYLSAFLLTHLLVDKLKASKPCRVVTTVAHAYGLGSINFADLNHERVEKFNPGLMYGQSKLAVLLFTMKIAKLLEGSGVTVNASNPGVVATNIHRYMPFRKNSFLALCFSPFTWFFMKRPKDGAQTTIQLAVGDEEEDVTGKLYKDLRLSVPQFEPGEVDKMDKLYEETCKLVDVAPIAS